MVPSLIAFVAVGGLCHAEQLPIRFYGVAEGLAGGVNAIRQDSSGFLWFATREGLSRFDGYEFDHYGRADGLTRDWIADFLETRSGVFWAATSDGVFRFDPNAPAAKKFIAYRSADATTRRVNVLYEDRAGVVWCGTDDGLYRLRRTGTTPSSWLFEPVPMDLPSGKAADRRVITIFEDSSGNLWIGAYNALYHRDSGGRFHEHLHFVDAGRWNSIIEDRQGRLWGGTASGLWRIVPSGPGEFRFECVYVPGHQTIIWEILEADAGKLWLAASNGLIAWNIRADGMGGDAHPYGEPNGLSPPDVGTLATDREGNLWMGSAGGAMRLARNGFVTYAAADHLAIRDGRKPALFQDRDGDVHVALDHLFEVMRGGRFVAIAPAIPRNITYLGWGWHQVVLQDHTGEWWRATGQGLVRFPKVPIEALSHTPPLAVYTTRNGLRTDDIFRIFEDSRGDIWVGCIGPAGLNGLSRWDRRTESMNLVSPVPSVPSAFAEDKDGTIWVGFYDGSLGRIRGGSVTYYGTDDGLAGGSIHAVHVDHAGRLWIGSLRGITRVDNPAESRPAFVRYGVDQGLSSNVVLCITEDGSGRVYLATVRGIDRIGADGRIAPCSIRHYTQADGLTKDDLHDILVDRHGVLWASSGLGVSRLQTEPDRPTTAPPVLIRGVRVRGVPHPSWNSGAAEPAVLDLSPDQNQLQIDFTGLAFAPGESLRYQFRLDPADRDWSEPSEQRTVNYSNVAPGRYRFLVRLITAGGMSSERPATLDFAIRPAMWQRWWFRALAGLLLGSAIYALHRYRTIQVVALERVRTRIAADLHDDIGSGLSQIAVLSEVARIRVDDREADLKAALANIGSVSRALSESMSDIVWSVNPQRDRVSDLVQRMRCFSSDLLSVSNIEFCFRAPVSEEPIRLATEVRREVYLIFKEAVNNLLRHSGCTRAEIEISIGRGWLQLRVEDNGHGLNGGRNGEGHGLRSMSERAKRIGGRLEFGEGEAGGLRVVLSVPLRSAAFSSGGLARP